MQLARPFLLKLSEMKEKQTIEKALLGESDRESAVNASDSLTAKGTYILRIGFMGRGELLERIEGIECAVTVGGNGPN